MRIHLLNAAEVLSSSVGSQAVSWDTELYNFITLTQTYCYVMFIFVWLILLIDLLISYSLDSATSSLSAATMVGTGTQASLT